MNLPFKIPEGWKHTGSNNYGQIIRHFSGICVLYSPILDEHHLSISYKGNQPLKRHIDLVYQEFGLWNWERDDQKSLLAHFWLRKGFE